MKIYVISLKESNDRRKEISKRMQELGLEFEFFDAVDGRQGLPKEYESMVDRNLTKKRYGVMSDGEYACALSHALLYKKIVEEKVEHAIILEDDVIIENDFSIMIQEKALEKSKKDFMFLYHLHTSKLFWGKKKFMYGYDMIKIARQSKSACGYYINNKVASYMAENSFPISYVADWSVNIMHFNTGAICPRIVHHPPLVNSFLENNRVKKSTTFGQFGFWCWFIYKLKKPFIKKIYKDVNKYEK